MYETRTEKAIEPKTTGELFKYIVKRLPKQILSKLPIAIGIAVVSWLVHTYLLVGPNGGFSPDTWLANNILNVRGKTISSTLLWAMLGGVVTMTISAVIQKRNPFTTFAEMAKIPGNIVKKNKATENAILPILLIVCGVTLLFEKLLSGFAGVIAGGIILSSVAALVMGTGGIFAMMFRLIFNDVQAFVLKKQKMKMDNETVYMILGASGMTFMLFGLFRTADIVFRRMGVLGTVINVILSWTWAILLLIGILLLVTKKPSVPKTMVFVGLFFLSMAVVQKLLGVHIFADDGGWSETGSTFRGWAKSEGALEAIRRGLLPAIAGVIGAETAAVFTGTGDEFSGTESNTTSPGSEEPGGPDDGTRGPGNSSNDESDDSDDSSGGGGGGGSGPEEDELQKQLAAQKAAEDQAKATQEHQDRLCKKYNTTPDKLREVMQANLNEGLADSERLNNDIKKLDVTIAILQTTTVVGDVAIDGLANVTGPGGKAVRATYKTVKGTLVGASEAYADGKSITRGATSGLVKGGADAASDYMDGGTKMKASKAVLAVGSEVVAGTITDGKEGAYKGLKNGAYNATVGAAVDKAGGGGYGNDTTVNYLGKGQSEVVMKSGGETITKVLKDSNAQQFLTNKITKQIVKSEVNLAAGLTNEFVAKPVLTDVGLLK